MHAWQCRDGTHRSMLSSLMDAQTVNFGLWIIGAICAATLLLSAGVAFVEFFLAVTNRCGRHTAGLAFLIGCVIPPCPLTCELT